MSKYNKPQFRKRIAQKSLIYYTREYSESSIEAQAVNFNEIRKINYAKKAHHNSDHKNNGSNNLSHIISPMQLHRLIGVRWSVRILKTDNIRIGNIGQKLTRTNRIVDNELICKWSAN